MADLPSPSADSQGAGGWALLTRAGAREVCMSSSLHPSSLVRFRGGVSRSGQEGAGSEEETAAT